MEGAKFTVESQDGKYKKANLVTDKNGTILIEEGLTPGKYTVTETAPPTGYLKSEENKQIVTIYENNDEDNPATVTFKNPKGKLGNLKIIKKDDKGNVLKDGFEFKIKGPDKYEKTAYITDGYGYIDKEKHGEGCIEIKNLPLGEYSIIETKAPGKYALDPEEKTVKLTEEGKTVEFPIINNETDKGKGKLTIVKKDKDTGEKLIGAKFRVVGGPSHTAILGFTRYECNKVVEITDKEGVTLSNLSAGEYKITEIEPPPGYKLAEPKEQTVTIKEGKDGKEGSHITVTFENEPDTPPPPDNPPPDNPPPSGDNNQKTAVIKVYKYDETTKQPLAGVTFDIYQQEYWSISSWSMFGSYSQQGYTPSNDKYRQYTSITTGSDGYASFTVPTSYYAFQQDGYGNGSSQSRTWYYKLVERGCPTPYDINDQKLEYNAVIDTYISDTEQVLVTNLGSIGGDVTIEKPNKLYGNLKLHKVDDEDPYNVKPMEGAKFKIYYYDETGRKHYISSYTEKENPITGGPAPSDVSFTTSEGSAKEFVTDKDGYISLRKLIAPRKYYAIETGLVEKEDEDFYRLFKEEVEFDLENYNSTATVEETVRNQQAYTKVSGTVWDDTHEEGKLTLRNNLCDSEEIKIKGIEVRLVYSDTGETVVNEDGVTLQAYTDENGYYEFKKVLKKELSDYSIVFKYNGLRYERVTPITNINVTNGSKADDVDREGFNANYAIIEKGVSKKADKTNTNKLTYTKGSHTSTLVKNLGYTAETADYQGKVDPIGSSNATKIYADTSIIDLKDYLKVPEGKKFEEVRHINLGIYEKEQPDISIMKDLQNIRTEINGKEHTYNYEQRFKNMAAAGGDGHDVGVKFGNKYGKMKYTRAIYKSDYTNVSLSEDKRLQVYVTYKIQMKNTSTSLQTKVNRLVDYYDSKYESLPKVGTNIDSTGKITNELKSERIKTQRGSSNQKLTIFLDDLNKIPAQQTQDIYVQFKLTRDTVEKMIEQPDGGRNLTDNVVEIDSYSVFDEWGFVYAGIDKDSEPGTITPGNQSTYEDDTDSAPPISWTQPTTNPSMREFRGKVFLDKTTGKLKSGEIREGDGKYDNSEPGIKDVKVKLVEKGSGIEYYIGEGRYKDKSGKTYNNYKASNDSSIKETNSRTDANGEYLIRGYVPGNYIIQYTWGGQTVTVSYSDDSITNHTETLNVQNYKSTIYDYTRYQVNDQYWYKGKGTGNNNVDLRYSDAIDDYNTRKNIDDKLKEVKKDDRNYPITEMTSTSLNMNIEVEYDQPEASKYTEGKSYIYNIHNVDFGIVERARQRIEIKKRISHLRVSLANGEVVSDVDISEGGTMTGEMSHVTFMGPIEHIGKDMKNPVRKPEESSYDRGFLKVELDNELLQGAKLELTYTFTFYNHSETDINNENYYKFGTTAPLYSGNYHIKKGGTDTGKKVEQTEVIKISPSVIVDYLDKDWGYEESKNNDNEWKAITKQELKELKDKVGRGIPLNPDIFADSISDINNRVILYTEHLANSAVLPNEKTTIDLNVSKQLTTDEDISLNNETEIVELDKWDHSTGNEGDNPPGIKGSEIPTMPGSKIPGEEPKESDESEAPTVIVTPSTGENLGYVIPIAIGVVAFAILGVGVVLIKKIVL